MTRLAFKRNFLLRQQSNFRFDLPVHGQGKAALSGNINPSTVGTYTSKANCHTECPNQSYLASHRAKYKMKLVPLYDWKCISSRRGDGVIRRDIRSNSLVRNSLARSLAFPLCFVVTVSGTRSRNRRRRRGRWTKIGTENCPATLLRLTPSQLSNSASFDLLIQNIELLFIFASSFSVVHSDFCRFYCQVCSYDFG